MLGYDLAQRQYFRVVVAGNVVGAAIGLIGLAGIGSDVDRFVDEQVDALEIRFFGKPGARFTKVVDWNLECDVDAVAAYLFRHPSPSAYARVCFFR